ADTLAVYPNRWGMVQRTRIISDGLVHMANLAVIGSHSVNGVARIHTDIIKNSLFKDYCEMWPERFSNKTNGITPRRFLFYSNPELASFLDDVIGPEYRQDMKLMEKLMDYVDDPAVQDRFLEVKQTRKDLLADRMYRDTGVIVYRHSIFDVQAKRLHAYKRQLLCILYVISLYQRIKDDPSYTIQPHTFIFAAKAASSYTFAKAVIRLINAVGRKVNNDPDTRGLIKVVFLPNYRVTMAEYLTSGADISEQISMAGKEASGTGNMKFMMNGAMTLGTLDGANVEIDELVGRENDEIFGLTVDEIRTRRTGYSALDLYNSDEVIRRAVGSLIYGTWSANRDDFRIIYEELIRRNDEYMVLADFRSYAEAQERIQKRFQDRRAWAKSCLINIAKSGYFSSDHAVKEYAEEIWKIEPLKM
ncbi:MAG: glycogen/starch/alpha-glucan phosphorylase, partial [Solobacterium sp.]|nr:glycogen/starch/alpha-glucan phosphorylase [Solobacterium sp.]